MIARYRGAVVVLALLALAGGRPAAALAADDGKHLGVTSCAGNNCHGAVQHLPAARVAQDEYLIWSKKDKHAKAYMVLTEPLGQRIAHNLGIADPTKDATCLNCHADNVPPDRRGSEFQLSDGVGCEACHGGAEKWLGIHLTGVDHAVNVAAGLYPTDQPLARAERCTSCHVGDDKRFATHRIMGAGHPPMPFELDTFTAIEPAHYTVDKSYIERKGRPNDMQIWAVGQAVDLHRRMDLILEQKNAPQGANPELSLFDCQACHHAMNQLQWQARASSGLAPGRVRIYDATAVMSQVIAARVAPDAAAALHTHMLALHKATGEGSANYWADVQREAAAVREADDKLIPALTKHDFTKEDAKAVAEAVIALGVGGGDVDYSAAQQETMALESIVAAMKALDFADDDQIKGLNDGLGGLYTAVANDQTYRPDTFVAALRQLQAKLPQ